MYSRTDAVESGGGGSPFGGSGGWEVKVWVAEVGPGEGGVPLEVVEVELVAEHNSASTPT